VSDPKGWVECVPNFSEGRDAATLTSIRAAIESVPAIVLLDWTADADHHRSVFTFVGSAEDVAAAAVAAAAVAVERIDLRSHTGVHPRIGAIDVLPFVPLEGTTLPRCVTLARDAAQRIWQALGVPAYFYEAAALQTGFGDLAELRRAARRSPRAHPDVGGPDWHPTAGAIAVGARRFLIAWNVNLNTRDVRVADAIARSIRASSGGLPGLKALGLALPERGMTQVSMNLVDFERTPLHVAYESVCREAARLGAQVADVEFIGLVPRRAWERSKDRVPGLGAELILEDRLGRTG
jgi:glutamate formiminotransferase